VIKLPRFDAVLDRVKKRENLGLLASNLRVVVEQREGGPMPRGLFDRVSRTL
jgi:hypothetical protein